ncbi:MAG: hypothetical protein ABIT08_04815 [Bacteroidia bacterium]
MHKIKSLFIGSLLVICFSLGLFNDAQGQRRTKVTTGYGAAIIYNFATAGFGADLRVKVPISDRLYAVPEISYFPGFNPYHEGFAGVALHYEILTIYNYNLYLLAGGYYNDWFNADDFAPAQKMQNNFSPQAGGGLVRSWGCIRPFIENRYDFKWKEDNLRIGIYWYPGSCGKKEKCPPSPT